MRLPWPVTLAGYSGLIPFLMGPLWLTLSPETAPAWLDSVWLSYVAMIASFMAGTFWGFSLPACEGVEGQVGLGLAILLMILAWLCTALPFAMALYGFALVYLLLLLADFWRERTLGTVEGYFSLRTVLTAGVLIALAWRRMLG